jgi:UDP-glucose 4-epimerase
MIKKTIFILGGFGFIASNILDYIAEHLSDLYDVIIFDKLNHHPEKITFSCVKKVYNGDYSDILSLETIFKENDIDIVIHALNTTVPSTSDNICFDIESNVIPTIKLFDLIVKYKKIKLIYLSSGGAIYGNKYSGKKHMEEDITYPISSYGIVKLTIEKYLFLYNYLYGLKSTILRLSNPYGKYHYNDKQGIINIALRSAFNSMPFFVWGDGNAEKDYIFIDDFCVILFKLLDVEKDYLLLNIGSGQIISVNNILNSIKNIVPTFSWNYKEQVKTDVQRFELDISKLLSIIGPYKFTDISVGLEKTISWLKNSK